MSSEVVPWWAMNHVSEAVNLTVPGTVVLDSTFDSVIISVALTNFIHAELLMCRH